MNCSVCKTDQGSLFKCKFLGSTDRFWNLHWEFVFLTCSHMMLMLWVSKPLLRNCKRPSLYISLGVMWLSLTPGISGKVITWQENMTAIVGFKLSQVISWPWACYPPEQNVSSDEWGRRGKWLLGWQNSTFLLQIMLQWIFMLQRRGRCN